VNDAVEDGVGKGWVTEYFNLPPISSGSFRSSPSRIATTRCTASD
jgi:hypothetical protein